jgi:hypothetical protein
MPIAVLLVITLYLHFIAVQRRDPCYDNAEWLRIIEIKAMATWLWP